MKRFIVILLLLLVLLELRAIRDQKEERECKCAEGEVNCPCLAQKESQKGASTNEDKSIAKGTKD